MDASGKIRMRGEDAIEYIDFGEDMFRIASLDQEISIIHSVLKLTSNKYRDAKSPKDQVRLVDSTLQLLYYDQSLGNIANTFKLTIKVIERDQISDVYNPGAPNTIFLYRHEGNSYEPVAKRVEDDSMCLMFT
jgi:hypothetical protein